MRAPDGGVGIRTGLLCRTNTTRQRGGSDGDGAGLRVLPAFSFSSVALPQPAPAPPFVRTPRQRWRRAPRPQRLPHQQLPLLVRPEIFHSVVELILFSPLLDLLRACAAAPPIVPPEAGGSKWVPGGVIAKVHLIIFLSNGTPLIQFKWDGFGSPI